MSERKLRVWFLIERIPWRLRDRRKFMFTLCRSKNIDDVTNPSLGPTLSRNTECTVDISLRNPYLVAYENSDLQVDVEENDSLRTFTDTSYESALTFAETYCAVGVCVVYDTVSHTTYIKSLQGITFILKFRPHFTLFQMVFYKEQTEAVTEIQNLIGGLSGMYTPKNPHITSLDDTDFPLSSPNLECFASYHTTTYYEAASIADAYCSLGVVVVYDIDSHIVYVRELSKCKGPKFSPNFISFRMVVPTKESEDFLLNHEEEPGQAAAPFQLKKSLIVPPMMNIVILVVGTRGDVQPFIYLGQALQKDGHRVRLATHKEYRDDVVKMGGLEYYPLEGDPRKLSEYMVKTGGRLMPDLLNKEERAELPEKMKMLKDICYSCYPACTACDPEDPIQRPFMADAIISNPVAYGHIHVAEALSIPLHIMFPQPWSPTKSFPHPLSGLSLDSKWSRRNYISYKMVDDFTWLGLGSMINKFRKNVLNLKPLRSGEAASSLLNDNKVPISHMWSPSFVPKCTDWPDHVDVVGEFRPTSESTSVYTPAPVLEKFLAEGERPLYIGFGSMVIEDATQLVRLIKEAAIRSGCRVLLQSGWTKYAADYEILCPGVMVVGAMPHDWLFERVAGVVHHGGAGTTSAGLRAGNPTFICPFFGDQYFWAEMVHRAGCGPPGCRIQHLTVDKLVRAFDTLRHPETMMNAKALGAKMAAENGVAKGVESFYRNLPLANMICEVSIFDNQSSCVAAWYCSDCDLKMSDEAFKVIHRAGSGREDHPRISFRCSRWGVVEPQGLLSGARQGMGIASYELAGGFYDLFAAPIKGGADGFVGVGSGVVHGLTQLFARPMKGGKILVDKVISGATADPSQNRSALVESALRKEEMIRVAQREIDRLLDAQHTADMEALQPTKSNCIMKRCPSNLDYTNLPPQPRTLKDVHTAVNVAAVQLTGGLWRYMTKLTASVPIFEKENESSGTDGDVVDETDEADDTEVIFLNSRERYVDAMVAASNNDKVVYDGEWKIPKRFRSDVMSNPVEEIKRFSTDAMVAHLGGSSDFTADFDSILTSKEKDITMAYKKAMHLMQWWKEVDRDHDRCINEKELRAAFPSSGTAKELVDLLDSDGDRLLTFTEVAWVLCNALLE